MRLKDMTPDNYRETTNRTWDLSLNQFEFSEIVANGVRERLQLGDYDRLEVACDMTDPTIFCRMRIVHVIENDTEGETDSYEHAAIIGSAVSLEEKTLDTLPAPAEDTWTQPWTIEEPPEDAPEGMYAEPAPPTSEPASGDGQAVSEEDEPTDEAPTHPVINIKAIPEQPKTVYGHTTDALLRDGQAELPPIFTKPDGTTSS